VFHNRLTHSLKVAQLARTIAEIFRERHASIVDGIGGIEPDAAEAAGLAHDLGHPPFGHIAEEELDHLVREAGVPDGFEGNAQSLRIVCRLAVSDAVTTDEDGTALSVPGLNLTRTTLAGVIKYPWAHGENPHKLKKWGYYNDEKDWFDWAREGCRPLQRTLVAEVMDWADDITYAVHDLLDFYRGGLIPVELVRRMPGLPDSVERQTFLERMFARHFAWSSERTAYEDALDGILDVFPFDQSHRYASDLSEEQALYQFATQLITRYANAIAPAADASLAMVSIQNDARREVDVLKEFIWQYVILNPEMAQSQSGQRRAVGLVFREALGAATRGEAHFFPAAFRGRLNNGSSNTDATRVAADYVAGLTERELLSVYGRLQALSS
jgi:dGTPase